MNLFSGFPKNYHANKRVSVMIKRTHQNAITDYEAVSKNLLTVNLTVVQQEITIVEVYGVSDD